MIRHRRFAPPISEQKPESDSFALFRRLCVISSFLLVGYAAYTAIGVLVVLFASVLLVAIVSPFLNRMNAHRIPDWAGILVVFSVAGSIAFLVVFSMLPIFLREAVHVADGLKSWFSALSQAYSSNGISGLPLPAFAKDLAVGFFQEARLDDVFKTFSEQFGAVGSFLGKQAVTVATQSIGVMGNVTSGIFTGVSVVVFSFFLVLERREAWGVFLRVIPKKASSVLVSSLPQIDSILYAWVKGQLLLSLSIFVLTFVTLVGLSFFFPISMKDCLTLALIAGLMEMVPYIGPFIALLPAAALAGGLGALPFVAMVVAYVCIQQVENNVLVPYVMSKTLDVSPFLLLVTITVLASLFGVLGIFLAVPVAAILRMAYVRWK